MKAYRRLFERAIDGIGRMRSRWQFSRSLRSTDVFIVTYPKSGTTWLGFLIANIIKRDSAEQINLRTFTDYIPDLNGIEYGKLLLSKFSRLPDPRFFFLHTCYDCRLPRVVYVLRDPRDVMVSFWHFRKLVDTNFSASLREFVAQEGQWLWRWDEYVAGWLIKNRHPALLVVRYEEMCEDTGGVLKKVLDFAGVKFKPGDIEKAVEASQFSKMRFVEKEHGWEGFNSTRGRFVRRGLAGGWREELDSKSLQILEKRYATVMEQVGYIPVTVKKRLDV